MDVFNNAPGWATCQDFERLKPLIEKLYDLNYLPEVMKFMETQHHLKATKNMYKNRIRKWGLDKKNKEPEMRAIVRKKTERSACGKSSVFRARGKPIDYEEVLRYWKRRRLSTEDILEQRNSREATPEGLECLTPLPSPISTPAPLAILEKILKCISDYFHSSFETGIWIAGDPTRLCYSAKRSTISVSHLQDLTSYVETGASLFDRKRYREGGQAMIHGTARIKAIVMEEEHDTLPKVIATISDLCERGYPEVGKAIMQQFVAWTSFIYCQGHPICRVMAWLIEVGFAQSDDVARKALSLTGDIFEHQLGFAHRSTTALRNLDMSFELGKRNPEEVGKAFLDRLRKCEDLCGVHDMRTMELRCELILHYIWEGKYVEAKRECQSIFQDAHNRCTVTTYTFVIFTLGRAELALHNIDSGEACMRAAIHLRMRLEGEQDTVAMQWMVHLEGLLVQKGRLESAAQVERRRLAIMATIEVN